ncbi:MAG: glycosyltransferase family 4 protein [Pseudomonadota bacterium]|nr:glycosyltransferase family 4 protein [Pseudomonadota bacterium]
MSLGILHTEASCGWGGQEIRILTEMQVMQSRGYRVHLVTPAHSRIHAAARARELPVSSAPIEFRRPAGLVALLAWLRTHGRSFDVINTHSSADSWLAASARTLLPRLPPIVRTRHVSTRVNRSRSTRWLYQRATSHIVVTGEALKRQLIEQNGFDGSRITSVRTGIDLQRFRPMDCAAARASLGVDERPAIAIVATLRDWKGHDDILDVWPELVRRAPGWQLLIVGDGPRRAHLEARVRDAHLDADVRFTGNREDVECWFACADVVTLPSWGEEGVPQSLMQAAACARVAVASDAGASAEALVHERTGFVVPAHDHALLTEQLAQLMASPTLRREMGDAARAHAEANFSIERMADGMEAVFRSVVAGAR